MEPLIPRDHLAGILDKVVLDHNDPGSPMQDGGVQWMCDQIARTVGGKPASYRRRYQAITSGIQSGNSRNSGTRICKHVTLRVADKFLTGLDLQHLWHTDPVLARIYETR